MSDYQVGDTIYHKFTTRSFSTGAPTTLAGTPVVSIYEDDSVTQITAGITLNVDFDSVTGLNHLTIVATGANGFETGKFYQAVITTGTVGGVSVVGEVVFTFSLEASAAALDLANGTDGLGAIKGDTAAILLDTGTDGVIVATNNDKTGYTVSTVSDKTGYSISGTITTLDALDTAQDAQHSTTQAAIAALNDVAATDIVSAGPITTLAGAVANVDLVDTLTTYTGNTPQTGDAFARLGAPAGASVSADVAAVKADTSATLTDTGTNLPAQISGLNDITAASVLAAGDVDGYSLEEALKLILSSAVGVLAGAATNTITIQAADGSKTRLTATVDADGNRSVVIKDATG